MGRNAVLAAVAFACIGACVVVAFVQAPRGTELSSKAAIDGTTKTPLKPAFKVRHTELFTPAVQGPAISHFDGWLHSGKKSSKHAHQDKQEGSDNQSDETSDEGGETWWEREHLASPPSGYHRPSTKKAHAGGKANGASIKKGGKTKKTLDAPEEVNEFHGEGADASPETIKEEIQKGIKPFGSPKKHADLDIMMGSDRRSSSIAQQLHKQHRTIASTLMDEHAHSSDHPKSAKGTSQPDIPDGM